MAKQSAASAMSFAHLAGVSAPRAEDGGKDYDGGEKSKKAKRAEDDDESKQAEEDDEDEKMSEDDGDGDGEDDGGGPKSKKAKRAENDDTDGDGDSGEDTDKDGAKASFRRGRLAERKRCARIFGSRAAARNLPLAANLAFNTGMSAEAALAALRDASAVAPTGRQNPNLGPNGAPGATSSQAVSASWDNAFAKTSRK